MFTLIFKVGGERQYRLLLVLVSWVLLLIFGFGLLYRHAYSAGAGSSTRLTELPSLESGERFRLLVFLHPHCPCSRATLAELRIILARSADSLLTEIWLIRPDGVARDWTDSELQAEAASLPNVAARWDDRGEMARRYDVHTSGEVLLADRAGTLRFRGGITASRGHRGPNRGVEAVMAILRGEAPQVSQTPVFGCPLERTFAMEDFR